MRTILLIAGVILIIAAVAFTVKKITHNTEKRVEQPSAAPIVKIEKSPNVASAQPSPKPDKSEERNKVFARRFYDDVVNKHNTAMIDSYASADYVDHQYDTHFAGNLKGMKKAFSQYFIAFPDMHVKVNFMTVEGDLVTTQITTTGTNTGPIYGRKGTGKKIDINGVDIVRIKDGKVVEHWGYAEEGKLLTQLGLIRPLLKEGRKEEHELKKKSVAAASSAN